MCTQVLALLGQDLRAYCAYPLVSIDLTSIHLVSMQKVEPG